MEEEDENFGFIGCEFFMFVDLWMVCEIESVGECLRIFDLQRFLNAFCADLRLNFV